MLSLLKLIAN